MKKNDSPVKFLPGHLIIKYIIIMKLAVIFVFGFTIQSLAINGYSQQRINIDVKNTSLLNVFKAIESKSNYRFVFGEDIAHSDAKIDIYAKDATIDYVMQKIIANASVTYKIVDKNLVVVIGRESDILLLPVKGKIIDKNGLPLSGVSVIEKGTNNGTTSNEDGIFFINVKNNDAVLTISNVGYVVKEIPVKEWNDAIMSIVLLPIESKMDEVVVVGYGTQKRYSVVAAVTTIEPEKLQLGTTRSLSNNLAGQLAGIIAVQRSGEPGYDNSNFWIRGISTFAGNRNPLVLVDGIERSLNNIDPAEIESFSILKDAAASAVYGVRGANGVILINTKRGKVGRPTVSVRAEQAFTQPVKMPSFVGAADYLEVFNSISEENGETPRYTQERIDNIRNGVDPDLYPDVNWLDAITKKNASNTRVNLNVSGGSDILRYAMVVSYYGEDGIIERDKNQGWNSAMKLRRYNLRSNVDLNVTPTTLFRINIGGYLQDDRRPPQSIDALFSSAFETPPYVHPTRYSSGEIPVVPERTNPWSLATQTGYRRSSASKIESLFSIEQNLKFILPGLKAKGIFSFDRYSNNYVIRSKSPDYYNPAIGRNPDSTLNLVIYRYGQDFLDYSTGSDWGDRSVYIEGNITYAQTFGNHNIDALFLYNQRNYDNGDKLPFRNQGIAGRFSYSYARRYIAEFDFGYNGSENFAKGQRFGFFPSVAVGWFLSEEKFMQPYTNTFSKIKLRASYGFAGNDDIGGRRFAYITTIGGTDGYRWGVNNDYYRAGRREGDAGVANLTWETVAKGNVGLELGLWNALELQVDVFKERRRDIFMQRRTIPASAGFINTPWANYGKVDNQGVDMSVDFNKQITTDFSMSVRGTFTYAKNKIIEQDEPSTIIGTNRSSTGKPVDQIFGLVAEGLFTNDDFSDIENGVLKEGVPSHTFGPVRPGDIKYKDVNADGLINDLDRTAIGGTVDPQIVYGFGMNVRYRSLDFGFFFQGNAKTDRIIGGNNFIPGTGAGSLGNIYTNVDNRWTVQNPRQDVFWPRLSEGYNANNVQASTWWLRDMSMLRLRNVEMGYNFKGQTINKVGMKAARLFVRGDNLLTLSAFDLWDPEIDTNNGFKYPIMKSFSLGIDVNF